MKKILIKISSVAALMAPSFALAQAGGATNITTLLFTLTGYVNDIIGFLVTAAVLLFVYGVIRYMLAGGDEDAVKQGRSFILWGLIGLAVIVSVWGLVNILTGSFGFTDTRPILNL